MTDNVVVGVTAGTAGWRPGRLVGGAVLGLAGHVVALAGAMIAGRSVEVGQGFDDLAAVALTFFGAQALFLVVDVIAGIMLISRRRVDLGVGVLGGWLLGAIFCVLIIAGLIRIG